MFLLAVLMMLGVLQLAEETSATPQMMESAGEGAEAEDNQELVQKKSEEGVEMRGLAEEEDVGEAAEEADEPMEGRNQQSAGNGRAIITGSRIVVKAVKKVFKKPSDLE